MKYSAATARLAALRRWRAPKGAGDERYTQPDTLALCAQLAGVKRYTLDVAACVEAHCAPKYFTRAEDGRCQRWTGDVWCNPPYSDIAPWLEVAWREMHARRPRSVSMLLPSVRTEQPWWQQHIEPHRDKRPWWGVQLRSHFLPTRQPFGRPGQRIVTSGSPPFGLVLLVWRYAR